MNPLSSTTPLPSSRIELDHAPTPRCAPLRRIQEGALITLKVISVVSAIAASILFIATGNPFAGLAAIGLTLLSVGLLTPLSNRVHVVSYPTPHVIPCYEGPTCFRLLPTIPTPLFMAPLPGGHARIPVGSHTPTYHHHPREEERIPVGRGGSLPLPTPFCPAPSPLVHSDGRPPVRNGGIAFTPDPSHGERRVRVGDGGTNTPPLDEGEQRVPVGRR